MNSPSKSKPTTKLWILAALGSFTAPLSLMANLPATRDLELGFITPTNAAYQIETSSDLLHWSGEQTLRFGSGRHQLFNVPLVDASTGYVRFALLGQPSNVGPAPWSLAAGNWPTYSQTQGNRGQIAVLAGGLFRLEIESSQPKSPIPFTYLRTGRDQGQLTCQLAGWRTVVDLTYATPTLGYYRQEYISAGGTSMDVRTGCYSTTTAMQSPTSIENANFIFAQNGEVQSLSIQTPPGLAPAWTLRKSGVIQVPTNVAYTPNGAETYLEINLGSGNREEYILNYTGPNGGRFTRKEIRGGQVAETLTGCFAVN